MTNAEARFNTALRPRKPEGWLGRTAQDGHLDSHTALEMCFEDVPMVEFMYLVFTRMPGESYRRRSRFLLCLCDVFRALINSLVCCLYASALGFVSDCVRKTPAFSASFQTVFVKPQHSRPRFRLCS